MSSNGDGDRLCITEINKEADCDPHLCRVAFRYFVLC